MQTVVSLDGLNRGAVCLSYSILRTSNNAHATDIANTTVTLVSTLRDVRGAGGLGTSPLVNLITTISINVGSNGTCLSLGCRRSTDYSASLGIIVARGNRFVRLRKATRRGPFAHTRTSSVLVLTRGNVTRLVTVRGATLN